MTEHSAVIFVFFFLAEYASIVLICLLTSVLFLGGYLSILSLNSLIYIYNFFFHFVEYIPFHTNYIFLLLSLFFSDYNCLNSFFPIFNFLYLYLYVYIKIIIFIIIFRLRCFAFLNK